MFTKFFLKYDPSGVEKKKEKTTKTRWSESKHMSNIDGCNKLKPFDLLQ